MTLFQSTFGDWESDKKYCKKYYREAYAVPISIIGFEYFDSVGISNLRSFLYFVAGCLLRLSGF